MTPPEILRYVAVRCGKRGRTDRMLARNHCSPPATVAAVARRELAALPADRDDRLLRWLLQHPHLQPDLRALVIERAGITDQPQLPNMPARHRTDPETLRVWLWSTFDRLVNTRSGFRQRLARSASTPTEVLEVLSRIDASRTVSLALARNPRTSEVTLCRLGDRAAYGNDPTLMSLIAGHPNASCTLSQEMRRCLVHPVAPPLIDV